MCIFMNYKLCVNYYTFDIVAEGAQIECDSV